MVERRLLAAVIDRLAAARSRIRRIERREIREFRRWIQTTSNLLHLSVVLFVPVLIGFVTYLSNQVQTLSFLLFPPLASGTYTLFSDPEGRYANPLRFVASLSAGALCGLVAYLATVWVYGAVPSGLVHPESAALAIFLTGAVTWAADIEAPSAFATALLALVTGDVEPVTYVISVVLAASLIAGAFFVWREQFYEKRATYLYETVHGDDHVLVPMRGEAGKQTALFGARLAAAHEAGKVVLCDVITDDDGDAGKDGSQEATSTTATDDDTATDSGAPAPAEDLPPGTAERIDRLERVADEIRTRVGVPCEVVVVSGDPVPATIQAGRNANCDLVVTPYEVDRGGLSGFVRGMFTSELDAIAFRPSGERRRWRRVLVLVARPGDTAHAMIDFATRLTHGSGMVSVTTCIEAGQERRRAETRLNHLVETVAGNVETRVARGSVMSFLSENAGNYDLVVLGSSGERSPASRFVSPPLFQQLESLDCEIAVFDRGKP